MDPAGISEMKRADGQASQSSEGRADDEKNGAQGETLEELAMGQSFKETYKQLVDERLRQLLPGEDVYPEVIHEAMAYSLFAGGKRFRPLLCLCACEAVGGNWEAALDAACALEMVNTYSLIHDDLPAIDNDDYRRGRLTTHKVYGEAMGVLSGVTLLNYAYETMFRAFELTDDKDRVIRAVRIMAEKTGIYGMLGGQSVDVENDGKPLEKDLLDYIYEHKTSALIEASMMAGAVLAGADEEQTSMIEQAASDIGLAFQIQDDILDVTSTSQELGKPVHSDEKNNKVTYVTLFGVQKASEQVRELSEKALAVLDRLYNKNEFLTELVMEMATRRK